MISLTGSIRAGDGRTWTITDKHGRNGLATWFFTKPSRIRFGVESLTTEVTTEALIFPPLPDRLNAAWEGVEGRSSGRCCGDGPFVPAFE
jgi:hypothetical protein